MSKIVATFCANVKKKASSLADMRAKTLRGLFSIQQVDGLQQPYNS